MAGWLRRTLRRWLASVLIDDETILCRDGERWTVVGVSGPCLIGRRGPRTMAIRPCDAADESRFWAIWRRRNPRGRLRWEDGSRFVPPE